MFDSKANIIQAAEEVQKGFTDGKTKLVESRKAHLRKLATFLVEHEESLVTALKADFKSHFEAVAELKALQSEVVQALDQLDVWTRSIPIGTPLAFWIDSCQMRYEPRGTALIVAPWNYPLDLLLRPLVGAMAAGCTAVLKPSEFTVNTVNYLVEHLSKYLEQDCYRLVQGGPEETQVLLEWPHWGLVFFTGSSRVGRIVASAAAANLIPTVLELGGKSPCIVTDEGVDLQTAAKRIMFGKLFNAGQTCVAPDYVIVTKEELMEPLREALIAAAELFYGKDPCESQDYSQIVSVRQWDRLMDLLKDQAAERVVQIGNHDRGARHFAPTLVIEPNPASSVMQQEIFGPILPILRMDGVEEAINFINAREEPLALYLFSSSNATVEHVLGSVSCGGCTVNDTVMHAFSGTLPLGGVGTSGMGRYRGKWTFESFSHAKPVMWRSLRGEFINDRTRNPPLTESKMSILTRTIFATPKAKHLCKNP